MVNDVLHTTLSIIDSNGNLIKKVALAEGMNNINLSNYAHKNNSIKIVEHKNIVVRQI